MKITQLVKPKIRVSLKSTNYVYGSICQPICESAHRFCQIAKVKFLNDEIMFHIQKLGFEIEVIKGV